MILDVKVNEDGEYYLEFPDEFLNSLGWKIGDLLDWIDNKDGTWSIKKMSDNEKYFVVDALSNFRCRYVVRGKSLEHALEEVTYRQSDHNFKEFSQKHLGVQIIDGREVTRDELLDLHKVDNDYLSKWTEEQILNGLTNIINYDE